MEDYEIKIYENNKEIIYNRSQFYTPTFDEICPNLEYYLHYDDGDIHLRYTNRIGMDQFLYESLIKHRDLLVKYLDYKDIEDLGWNLEDKNSSYYFSYKDSRESYLIFYPTNLRIEIGDNESYNGFSGTIKNKLELKKLMEQLEIK